jgi:hypothetical protein
LPSPALRALRARSCRAYACPHTGIGAAETEESRLRLLHNDDLGVTFIDTQDVERSANSVLN